MIIETCIWSWILLISQCPPWRPPDDSRGAWAKRPCCRAEERAWWARQPLRKVIRFSWSLESGNRENSLRRSESGNSWSTASIIVRSHESTNRRISWASRGLPTEIDVQNGTSAVASKIPSHPFFLFAFKRKCLFWGGLGSICGIMHTKLFLSCVCSFYCCILFMTFVNPAFN